MWATEYSVHAYRQEMHRIAAQAQPPRLTRGWMRLVAWFRRQQRQPNFQPELPHAHWQPTRLTQTITLRRAS